MLMLLCCLWACSPEQAAHSDFKHLPQQKGWSPTMPISLKPVYADSTATYDIELAVRHDTSFPYKKLTLAVDFDDDSAHTHRRMVTFDIADDNGNWLGAGFGSLYQCRAIIAENVKPGDVNSVLVWQTTTDSINLKHVTDLGIIVKPINK